MGEATPAFSLSNAEATQWNRGLMLKFQAILERDPTADPMSLFPDSYRHEHRISRYNRLSYAAKINHRTLDELRDGSPKADQSAERAPSEETGPPDFRTHLDLVETATVVFPLSEKVTTLLAQPSEGSFDSNMDEKSLAASLKQLAWDSPKLWETPVRGVMAKCSEDIAAKIIWGNREYTEYTSMQYLAERAPGISAPKPHGLVALGPFRAIFMSYIPGLTLKQAWPSLSHDEKLSLQSQLDDIFRRLRTLRQEDGGVLGGVGGEGVKDLRVDECATFKDITTAKGSDDLQFSANHHGSTTHVRLLHSFLDRDNASSVHDGLVFTHGDIRTDNIMVERDLDARDHYAVTGIIDWENSGFYPEYYECTALTRTLSLVDEDDWYLYLPESIAPSQFPVRWLVDRLWGIHVKTT